MTARRGVLAAMLGAFAVIVISCGPGVQDYVYSLPGGYRLYRCSRDVIVIQYDGGPPYPKDAGIGAKVVALNWDERYVLAKQQRADGHGKLIRDAFDWWVLDTRDHVRRGPLTEEGFVALRNQLGIDPNLELKKPTEFIDHDR